MNLFTLPPTSILKFRQYIPAFSGGEGLHVFELVLDGAGAYDVVELTEAGPDVFWCFFGQLTKLFKLVFDSFEDFPDLAAALLQGQGETHGFKESCMFCHEM